MSNHGVVAISRGIWDHPIFAPEPFTEREAWQWLIHQAAWRPTKTRPGRALMDLERGQLAFATRFMATKWKWTETRVRRFLRRLESDAMVIVQPTRNATRITVCNYNRWQFGGRIDDAPTNAPPARPRRKEEESKTSKKEESSLLRSEDSERVREEIESGNKHTIPADIEASLIEPTLFMRLWKAYPSRGNAANPRKPAVDKFARLLKAGASADEIIAGAERYGEIERKAGRAGTDKIAQAITWLNQERWRDYAAAATEPPPTEPVPIKPETEEWSAWWGHHGAHKNAIGMSFGQSQMRRAKGVGQPYMAPTQWPPGYVAHLPTIESGESALTADAAARAHHNS